MVRGLLTNCLWTDWKKLPINNRQLSVLRYVRFLNYKIQWSRNLFATCRAVAISVAICVFSFEKRFVRAIMYRFP